MTLHHAHDNELSVFQWPSESPDLNPLKQLWDVVKLKIKVHLNNLQESKQYTIFFNIL